jgi:hypothetical protein
MKDNKECCEGNREVHNGCYHDHCTGPGTRCEPPLNHTREEEIWRIEALKIAGFYKEFKHEK